MRSNKHCRTDVQASFEINILIFPRLDKSIFLIPLSIPSNQYNINIFDAILYSLKSIFPPYRNSTPNQYHNQYGNKYKYQKKFTIPTMQASCTIRLKRARDWHKSRANKKRHVFFAGYRIICLYQK